MLRLLLNVRGAISGFVEQPLAVGPLDDIGNAFRVLNAKASAAIVAELEFGEVAMQVRSTRRRNRRML